MVDSYAKSYQTASIADEVGGDLATAVIAGIEIAGAEPIGSSERFYTQLVPAGAQVEIFDLEGLEEALAPHPRRKKGTVHVQDADSFIGYVEKHGLPATEVFADEARRKLVAVINAHEESVRDESAENKAGHGDHRVHLELIATDAWVKWTSLDKKWMDQQPFAEHLEDNSNDVLVPAGAEMLEIAESFQASMSAEFKQSERLHSGVVSFKYEESQGARAGHNGDLDIPTQFTLSLAPFVGADPVEVLARFRYRIRGGKLSLSYALMNTEEISRQAFVDHVEAVRDAVAPLPVFAGRPE